MENTTKAKTIVTDTVQVLPNPKDALMNGLVIQMANFQDNIPKWGTNVKARDKALDEFWRTEDFLSATINSIAMRRAGLPWELSGPPKVVNQTQQMLKRSDFGAGFHSLIAKLTVSILSQDNGGFIEIVRAKPQKGRRPESGVVLALNNLPSSMVTRTGNPETPCIYTDTDGKHHLLKWYECIPISEVAIPRPDNKNIQFCFVSRVMNFSKTFRAIQNYQQEKIEGRFGSQIHIVSGVSQVDVENIQEKSQLEANNQGMLSYMAPVILSTIDPSSQVSLETIDLAGFPESFNYEDQLHAYILLLSLGAGVSFTSLAPLFKGNLGSGSQSDTLSEHGRVKSLLLFMKIIENALQNHKVIPPSVSFKFKNSDGDQEARNADISYRRAQTRKTQIETGEITPAVARRISVDNGDMQQIYITMMDEYGRETVTVTDAERVSEKLPGSDSKPLPSPNDTPTPDNTVDVSVDVAEETSKWFVKMIENNPINDVLPIPESQINTFQVALRNNITKEVEIGTDDIWLSNTLTSAAKQAGIEAQMLRYRLPDNYKVLVTKDGVQDNKGSVIYSKLHKKDTSFNITQFLEDLSFDNWQSKLTTILNTTKSKVTKQYITEIHKVAYFDDIEMIRVKLMGTYYRNLAK